MYNNLRYIKWYEYLWLWIFKTKETIDVHYTDNNCIVRYKKVGNDIYVISETII